jgi:hypothetical protein
MTKKKGNPEILSFDELKGSYSSEELVKSESFRNYSNKLDSLEFKKIIEPTKIGGITASRKITSEFLNSKFQSVIFFCDIVDSGGIQLLVNLNRNDEFVDYLTIAEVVRQGPWEKDGLVCFGKDRTCVIKNDTIIITDKFKMAINYTADSYFEEITSKYIVISNGTFMKIK